MLISIDAGRDGMSGPAVAAPTGISNYSGDYLPTAYFVIWLLLVV